MGKGKRKRIQTFSGGQSGQVNINPLPMQGSGSVPEHFWLRSPVHVYKRGAMTASVRPMA